MDEQLITRAKDFLVKYDLASKRAQVETITQESSQPGFWQDSQVAAKKMKKMAAITKEVEAGEMIELMIESGASEELQKELDRMEFALYLSGPYDQSDAIFSIHSGQGGTEAMDWTSMLMRMYMRFAERKEWDLEEMDKTMGEEAGVKSVTFTISGPYAYGFLKAEVGVHRLVRQSPFNADNLRQTSFAMVEVLPVVEDANIEVKEEELEWDFFRAGGKGGQNVNKVSTAVRLKHLPTGIIVASQAQRYQGQNREFALKMLKAKLWEIEEEKRRREEKNIRGEYKTPGWGNQIRNYVLHPYHLVKDTRTGLESSNTDRVLDGDIEDFMIAYLKTRV